MKFKIWQLIRLAMIVTMLLLSRVMPGEKFSLTWAYRIAVVMLSVDAVALLSFLLAPRQPRSVWTRVEAVGFVVMLIAHATWLWMVHSVQSAYLGVFFGALFSMAFGLALLLVLAGNLAAQFSKQKSNQ